MGVFVKFLLHLDSSVDDSCVTQNLYKWWHICAKLKSLQIFPLLLCQFGCFFQYELNPNFPRFATIHTRCFHRGKKPRWTRRFLKHSFGSGHLFSVQNPSTFTGGVYPNITEDIWASLLLISEFPSFPTPKVLNMICGWSWWCIHIPCFFFNYRFIRECLLEISRPEICEGSSDDHRSATQCPGREAGGSTMLPWCILLRPGSVVRFLWKRQKNPMKLRISEPKNGMEN